MNNTIASRIKSSMWKAQRATLEECQVFSRASKMFLLSYKTQYNVKSEDLQRNLDQIQIPATLIPVMYWGNSLKNTNIKVASACNPSYLGGEGSIRPIASIRLILAIGKNMTPYLQYTKAKRTGGMALLAIGVVVQCLLSKCETLSSNPNTPQKNPTKTKTKQRNNDSHI
jgi:hypothetical protein